MLLSFMIFRNVYFVVCTELKKKKRIHKGKVLHTLTDTGCITRVTKVLYIFFLYNDSYFTDEAQRSHMTRPCKLEVESGPKSRSVFKSHSLTNYSEDSYPPGIGDWVQLKG